MRNGIKTCSIAFSMLAPVILPFNSLHADIFDIPAKDPVELYLHNFRDSSDNTETGIRLYTITDSFFQLTAGIADISTKSPEQTINSHRHLIEFGTDPYQLFSLQIRSQHWHAPDALNIDYTRSAIVIKHNDIQFDLSLQQRDIELFTIPGAPRNRFNISAQDIGGSMQYSGLDDWLISFNWQKSKYSRNLTISEIRPIVLYYLQPSALSLSSGFEKKNSSLTFSYLQPESQITLSYGLSESAIDQSELRTYSIELLMNINYNSDIAFATGESKDTTTNKASIFYTVTLSYYFY